MSPVKKHVHGTDYIKVKELQDDCTGCAGRGSRGTGTDLCDKLGNCSSSWPGNRGVGYMWITDTPEGIAKYITLKLTG